MDYLDDLTSTVSRVTPVLLAVPAEVSARRPAPGKWSAKEILGHLIDSASNNHQRFVRAPSQNDLVFPGYDQDDWVRSQDYQHAPWDGVVTLWRSYNEHLARVMAAIPSSVRLREHARHNLDDLAWRRFPAGRPGTLDYLMSDYVAHMHHHLDQIGTLVDATL